VGVENAGLILEGGGLRGVYTSGVLHFFLDKKLHFPYVIGVSMGACNAASYVSRQPERNRIVNVRYVNDSRYINYFRLLTKGELFGMKFIFDTIPGELVPFDFKSFFESEQKCFTTVTDCITGEALYYEKSELGEDYMKMLQASSSLPYISKPVHYKGRILMDGGLSDSVPIRKSIHDGNKKTVLVLTRPKGYRKKRTHFLALARLWYPRYKGLYESLKNRHVQYNETMDYIEQLEDRGKVLVIRPRSPLNAGRIEQNKQRLYATYDQGYEDASASYAKLCSYLTSDQHGDPKMERRKTSVPLPTGWTSGTR
jgi:predicted patatin/cPLA2 family phospholipase